MDWREWQRVPGHYNPWIFQRRDACWGVTEKRTTPPLLFITLPSRGGLNSLSFSLSLSLSLSSRSVVLHSFPPLSDGCIIAHYSYHEIWIIHSIERRDVWCRRHCDCNRDAVKDVPATRSLAFLLPSFVPRIDDNHGKNVNLRLTNVKSGKLTVRSIIW